MTKELGAIHIEVIIQLDNITGGRDNWTKVRAKPRLETGFQKRSQQRIQFLILHI